MTCCRGAVRLPPVPQRSNELARSCATLRCFCVVSSNFPADAERLSEELPCVGLTPRVSSNRKTGGSKQYLLLCLMSWWVDKTPLWWSSFAYLSNMIAANLSFSWKRAQKVKCSYLRRALSSGDSWLIVLSVELNFGRLASRTQLSSRVCENAKIKPACSCLLCSFRL